MRVLHIINDLNSGGAQKLLEEMLPIINQARDIEADILLLSGSNNVFYGSLIKQGVEIKIGKYNSIYDPRNIFEISKYLKTGNYDIVHCHLFPAQYWLALSRVFYKNEKTKFVTTEHSTFNRRRKWLFFRFIDKYIYSKYDLIISVSKKTKENLVEWIDPKGKNLGKHIVIENGIDLLKIEKAEAYNKSDLTPGIDKSCTLVCMAASFTEQKDQPTLIRAISRLPEQIHLILLGEGKLKGFNENFARELGISHRVHFLGFRLDISRILKTVDIIVLSSHWEGLSLAAVEGMAAAKPLIASKVQGLSEVVSGYGLIYEKGNEDELAALITGLTEDEQLYNEISSSCKERSQDFSIQKTTDSLLDLYRTMC